VIVPLIVAAIATQTQQVELRVTYPGGKSGTARASRKERREGGWVAMMAIELESAGKKIKVRAESTFNAKFEPIRKTMETTDQKGKRLSYIVVDFDDSGAQVIIEAGAKRDVKRVALDAKWPKSDPTLAWFVSGTPEAGTKTTFMAFEMSSLNWIQRSAKYLGNKMVRVGNQSIRGHQLTLDGEPMLLDQHGMPIKMELRGVTFERVVR